MSISFSREMVSELAEVMDLIHASNVVLEGDVSGDWPDDLRISFTLDTKEGNPTMFALQLVGEFGDLMTQIRETSDEEWIDIFYDGLLNSASKAAKEAAES